MVEVWPGLELMLVMPRPWAMVVSVGENEERKSTVGGF